MPRSNAKWSCLACTSQSIPASARTLMTRLNATGSLPRQTRSGASSSGAKGSDATRSTSQSAQRVTPSRYSAWQRGQIIVANKSVHRTVPEKLKGVEVNGIAQGQREGFSPPTQIVGAQDGVQHRAPELRPGKAGTQNDGGRQRSTARATALPPPRHNAAMPRLALRRSSS